MRQTALSQCCSLTYGPGSQSTEGMNKVSRSLPTHVTSSVTHVSDEGDGLSENRGMSVIKSEKTLEECSYHLDILRCDVTVRCLDIVRDPLCTRYRQLSQTEFRDQQHRTNKVRAVLLLDRHHAVLDLAHRDLSAEVGCDGEVSAVSGVRGGHHVARVEHLLRELGDGRGTEAFAAGSSHCRGDNLRLEVV